MQENIKSNMGLKDYQKRFGGISRLYGDDCAQRLTASHVAIIGVGGVGSWVAESLARTGIGQMTLIDLDEISESNINRQSHALTETLGRSKTAVMKERIISINPDCKVYEIAEYVEYENLEECMSLEYDYVIDAIDSAAIKAAMINWCKRNKIPIITIGGAGGKIDPTKIQIGDLNKTKNDPLLAKVRSQLRAYHGFTRNPKKNYKVDAVYSIEQVRYPNGSGGTTFEKPGDSNSLDCTQGFGSITHLTGSFAYVGVAKVLDKLLVTSKKVSCDDSTYK